LIKVGRVLRSQGKSGELKLRFDEPAGIEISRLSTLSIGREGDVKTFRVEALISRGRDYQVKLAGVDDLAAASSLAGQEIFLAEDEFRPLEEGQFYVFQLMGCLVMDAKREKIGPVVDIIPAGGTEILVVDRQGKEILIPFHASLCPRVDIAAREITVDLPDGLLDLNEI